MTELGISAQVKDLRMRLGAANGGGTAGSHLINTVNDFVENTTAH